MPRVFHDTLHDPGVLERSGDVEGMIDYGRGARGER